MHLLENPNNRFSAETNGGGRDAAIGSSHNCERRYLFEKQSKIRQKKWTQSWLKIRLDELFFFPTKTSAISASLPFLLPLVWCCEDVSLIPAQLQRPSVTLVIPRTPIFGLEDVEPFPVPRSPAMMQQTPSVKIPLRTRTQLHTVMRRG